MRLSAALLGAPTVAIMLTAALTAVLPAPSDIKLLAAMLAVFPAIVAGICLSFWSRSAARVWAVCLGLGALSFFLLRAR
jgi:hypothetical protein